MRCQFVQKEGGIAECVNCGLRVRSNTPEQIYAECQGRRPSAGTLIVNYAKAVAVHVSSGGQTRTDAEVSELLKVCETCEFFQNGVCRVCGCRVNSGSSAFANKLRMKTQRCPKGKWR